MHLKQFVPSEVCLKCEGCCRFQSADSIWRPKWDKREFVDAQNYVTTIKDCGKELCRFFNKGDGTCRTYHDRPFECELYPFLLSRHAEGVKVYVHLACPYVQDMQGQPQVEEYIAYLRGFFNKPATREFLASNSRLIHDYAPVEEELQHLFTIQDIKLPAEELLSYKPLFDDYLSRSPKPLSCYHFSSIFAWQDFFKFSFEVIDGRLCVFARQGKDSFLYLPPLGGEVALSTLEKCFERMQGSRIGRLENFSDNPLITLKGRAYNTYLKAHEYLYRRLDLAELSGSAYKSKRHDVHVFNAHHPAAEFRGYAPADHGECVALYGRWAANRKAHYNDPVYLNMLEDNAGVHALLLKNIDALGLAARVVCVDGRIAGYTCGYALDERTFCVLLEVTDLEKAGSAAYIFNKFCLDLEVAQFELINTMDDFGLPNVAAVKESYHPCGKLPVYVVKKI